MKKKNILLIISAVFLFLIGLNSPQGMILPLLIIVYLLKNKIIKITDKMPLTFSFILTGSFFGLLTELFAILNNINVPYGKRILLSQDFLTDILLAPAYYTSFITFIFLLVRKYGFSLKSVFIFSGLFGIFAENNGTIFFNIFSNPVFGIINAFFVMCVYGIFPLLTYMLHEHRFNKDRTIPDWKIYLILPVYFFIFWALFGNFILPGAKFIVAKISLR